MKLQRSNDVSILCKGQDAQEAAKNNPKANKAPATTVRGQQPLAIVPSSYVQPFLAVS
jgi:hypothetical protein